MKVIKLKPISSFHIGERENFWETTQPYIHSDTLFSAFCNAYLLLYGEKKLNELIDKFVKNPPFLISSAFPYWNEKIFFPIPLNQIPKEKEVKKIEFIEKDGFEQLLNGMKIDKIWRKYITIPFKTKDEEFLTPYEIIINPRISVGRLSNSPGENYFHFGEVFYKNPNDEKSGLFFLVDFKEDIEKEFFTTLRLMVDEGIGGDRTVGKGHFKLEEIIENIEFKLNNNNNNNQYQVNLSLYLPKEDEIKNLKDGYYEIIERKGYIYSPYCKSLRKKSVRMFKEGSVFPKDKIGKIIDITPEIFKNHKIYRYGLAFSLPCEVKNED
ncbi:MAG: type III-A CRISPR-associated RAMP protein Csm4 [bacterium]|nr:type III-A CRISPR-associated RAMP protein Csm4 [bacterium]